MALGWGIGVYLLGFCALSFLSGWISDQPSDLHPGVEILYSVFWPVVVLHCLVGSIGLWLYRSWRHRGRRLGLED